MSVQAQSISPIRLIKLRDVSARTGISASELYRRIAAGTFPRQIHLGPKSVAWLESDVNAWIEARVVESMRLTA